MWLCFCLLLCLIGGLLLDSYAKREITKTIVLEEKDGQSAENEYVVKNIKEYFYEGVQKEEGWIAVEQDSEYIYALKYIEDGYEYQKIDIGQEKILSSLVVETEPLEQVKIAPGGKYIAYERQYPFGVELVMYFVEDESQLTLGAGYGCSFAWSGDGTRLFYTFVDEGGTDYDANTTWVLSCFDTAYPWDDASMIIDVEGDIGIPKNIVPNRDGSEIYVGYENANMDTNRQDWLFLIDDFMVQDNMAIEGKAAISQRLLNLPEEVILPIQFTEAGLFAYGEGEKIYLITNLEETPRINVVDEIDYESIYVCENGDHLFVLKQEEGTKRFEVRILRLKEGKVVTDQLLYKDVSQNWADAVVSMDDRAIVLKTCEYLNEKKYSFKITRLEYGDR
ncbi:MAG: hypothetical protein J6D02_08805 [Lachnospira sp.]|nr:hypothetical protein [Lachnospira sp.]